MARTRWMAVVPAAGKARRLPAELRPKELLTVGHVLTRAGTRPKAVSEYVIEALASADVRQVCVIIASGKEKIVDFFGFGEAHGVEITYVCQVTPVGLAHAIDTAYARTIGRDVVLGVPDTVFRPPDAVRQLTRFFERHRLDLALGIFPTDDAGRLGPVILDRDGTVRQVLEKPGVSPVGNTWGLACWGPAFTQFLHDDLLAHTAEPGERSLGAIFDATVRSGLRVRGLFFRDGLIIDVGTLSGLYAARSAVAEAAADFTR